LIADNYHGADTFPSSHWLVVGVGGLAALWVVRRA